MSLWDQITGIVSEAVKLLAPIVEAAAPEAAATAVSVATKIVTGVIAAEPTAVALYNQIKSGTPPSADQLKQFEADYEASYQELKATIAARLADGSATA